MQVRAIRSRRLSRMKKDRKRSKMENKRKTRRVRHCRQVDHGAWVGTLFGRGRGWRLQAARSNPAPLVVIRQLLDNTANVAEAPTATRNRTRRRLEVPGGALTAFPGSASATCQQQVNYLVFWIEKGTPCRGCQRVPHDLPNHINAPLMPLYLPLLTFAVQSQVTQHVAVTRLFKQALSL